jgi:Family of unknown function (DUF6328)
MVHDGEHRDRTADRAGETPAERADRNMNELLQELRVAQTGVQVLLAFLLTAPLQAGFHAVNAFGRALLLADLVAMTVAAICLIGPVAWHRVLFRRHLKDEVVAGANRLARAGLVFLGAGLGLSLTLAVDLLLDVRWALVFGAATIALAVVLWLVLPWRRRADPE